MTLVAESPTSRLRLPDGRLAAHLGNPCVHLHEQHGHMSLAVAGYPAILDSLVAGT